MRKKNSLTIGAEADPGGGGWRPPWASRSLAVGARDFAGMFGASGLDKGFGRFGCGVALQWEEGGVEFYSRHACGGAGFTKAGF
jgi:hypothetical protein